MRTFERSAQWLDRALAVTPIASQTMSKMPDASLRGRFPFFFVRGEGCRVWDLDGNEYLDFESCLGPIVLGYCYPPVQEAVARQLADGSIFSGPHPLEAEVAELVRDLVPCAEMMRFGKNGVDATSALVRAARQFTGRDLVVHYGYHGWADWSTAERTDDPGIPEGVRALTKSFDLHNPDSLRAVLEAHAGRVAVVMVALPYDRELDRAALAAVRDLTHEHGALLAYDEIVTGFRLAPGGAQEYYGVVPDLAAFAKALSNGFPLSVWCGWRDVIAGARPWTCSLTYGGDTLALAAAKACLTVMREEPVHEHLWRVGAQLRDGLAGLLASHGVPGQVVGLAPLLGLSLDLGEATDKGWEIMHCELAQQGVLHRRGHRLMPTYSHQPEDIARALEGFDAALAAVAMLA